jgi:hypothetical protein
VQLEHLALLPCLARRHGLRRVFVEGMAPEGVKNFREMVAALKNVEPQLREQLQDVQSVLQGAQERTARHAKAKEIEGEVLGLLERFRLDVLPFGTAGRLLMSGDIEEVLALDDAKLLDEAKPIRPARRLGAGRPERRRLRPGHPRRGARPDRELDRHCLPLTPILPTAGYQSDPRELLVLFRGLEREQLSSRFDLPDVDRAIRQ